MLKTFEAIIKTDGSIHLLEKVKLDKDRKALVTILDNNVSYIKDDIYEVMLLSESSLAKDWQKPKEDEAWKDF